LAELIEPLFRVMTSLISIIGGLGHFGQHRVMLARMQESPWYGVVTVVGDPSMLLWLSGLLVVVFRLTLALDGRPPRSSRPAAPSVLLVRQRVSRSIGIQTAAPV
jgi:hypothetical protein